MYRDGHFIGVEYPGRVAAAIGIGLFLAIFSCNCQCARGIGHGCCTGNITPDCAIKHLPVVGKRSAASGGHSGCQWSRNAAVADRLIGSSRTGYHYRMYRDGHFIGVEHPCRVASAIGVGLFLAIFGGNCQSARGIGHGCCTGNITPYCTIKHLPVVGKRSAAACGCSGRKWCRDSAVADRLIGSSRTGYHDRMNRYGYFIGVKHPGGVAAAIGVSLLLAIFCGNGQSARGIGHGCCTRYVNPVGSVEHLPIVGERSAAARGCSGRKRCRYSAVADRLIGSRYSDYHDRMHRDSHFIGIEHPCRVASAISVSLLLAIFGGNGQSAGSIGHRRCTRYVNPVCSVEHLPVVGERSAAARGNCGCQRSWYATVADRLIGSRCSDYHDRMNRDGHFIGVKHPGRVTSAIGVGLFLAIFGSNCQCARCIGHGCCTGDVNPVGSVEHLPVVGERSAAARGCSGCQRCRYSPVADRLISSGRTGYHDRMNRYGHFIGVKHPGRVTSAIGVGLFLTVFGGNGQCARCIGHGCCTGDVNPVGSVEHLPVVGERSAAARGRCGCKWCGNSAVAYRLIGCSRAGYHDRMHRNSHFIGIEHPCRVASAIGVGLFLTVFGGNSQGAGGIGHGCCSRDVNPVGSVEHLPVVRERSAAACGCSGCQRCRYASVADRLIGGSRTGYHHRMYRDGYFVGMYNSCRVCSAEKVCLFLTILGCCCQCTRGIGQGRGTWYITPDHSVQNLPVIGKGSAATCRCNCR